jgi:aerobic carbon-monoxide dehydrogenase medium subunit
VRFAEPTSIRDAVHLVRGADGAAKYLSGGTAMVLLVKMRMLAPDLLVSLRALRDVPGWNDIDLQGDALFIGGGATLSDIAASEAVRRQATALAEAAEVVGNVRIRNAATLGGLLAEADYASDPPAALVALGADVVISDGSETRTMPVYDFITDFFTTELEEAEVVTGIRIPLARANERSRYLKFCSRSAEDRPCVGVAAAGSFEGDVATTLRVVVGAVSGRPQWFQDVTAPFEGQPLDTKRAIAVGDAYAGSIDPIDDIRGSQWYRREVTRAQVERSLTAISGMEAR